MRKPTPVMISKNNDDSGSTRKLIEAEKFPAEIQLYNVTENDRSASGAVSSLKKSIREMMNDSSTAPQAMNDVTPWVSLRVFSATIKKPSSGNKGTRLISNSILTILNDSEYLCPLF